MITPIEIQNKEFRRAFRGYSEDEVDDFLKIVTEDFESLYKENMDLKEKVNVLTKQVESLNNELKARNKKITTKEKE